MPTIDSQFLRSLSTRQERVSAVVLAGGLARRMQGQDKGLVEIGGKPMAAWAVQAIYPQVHSVLINANRNHERYQELLLSVTSDASVVADRHSGHIGPLAGLSAALHHSDTQYMFMCPCDSPFVDAELVSLLGCACLDANADVAVAHDGERMQPVFCLVNKRCLASLDTYLNSGERKIDRWYAQVKTVEVDCSGVAHSFRNINTEEERLAAQSELIP